MKTMKLAFAALCCMTTLSFTACSDDDSSHALTQEEKAQCLMAVKGNYTGHLIYAAKNDKNVKDVTDTVDVKWSIVSDSIMTIEKFPTKLLAENVTDTTLKAALKTAEDQTITCSIDFVKTSPVHFLVNPKTPAYILNYGGKDHKVQVAFFVNNYSSFGSYDLTKKVMSMQIIEGAIFLDGNQTAYLKEGVPFVFVSTKKE